MRWILIALIGVHGLIHLMGFAKGFGWLTEGPRSYRDFGPVRLMSFGQARWLLPEGWFTCGEFNLVDITYNGR